MKLNLYCVKDSKTSKSDLFLEENDVSAKRSFEYAIKSDLKKAMFAGDYVLYYLGNYDHASMSFNIEKAPKVLMPGSSILGNEVNDNEV